MSYRRLSTALLSAITLSIAAAALAQVGRLPQEQEPGALELSQRNRRKVSHW